MTIAASLLTYEQYMAEGEINRRYDILDGERVFMTNPSVGHQDICFNIATPLKIYGRSSGRGRMILAACDVLIRYAPLRTRQPDVLFISHERFGSRDVFDPAPLSPAPELVVEVLSPSDTIRVLDSKIADYCSVGVLECWVVSPGMQTVEVMRLSPQGAVSQAVYAMGETLHSPTFPDLTLTVAEIFAL